MSGSMNDGFVPTVWFFGRKIKLTPLEQEIEANRESWLERTNMHF